jgi:hypothetical protein
VDALDVPCDVETVEPGFVEAGTAVHRVSSAIAGVEAVVAHLAGEHVASRAAVQTVVSGSASQDVVPAATVQHVVPGPSQDHIVGVASRHRLGATRSRVERRRNRGQSSAAPKRHRKGRPGDDDDSRDYDCKRQWRFHRFAFPQ